MKRWISILLVAVMILATVSCVIPAFALETYETALGVYNINWKQLYDSGTMRAQWLYDRSPAQNNMDAKYDITATNTSLSFDVGTKGGDHRQYYSDVMFDLTADTQYVYEFEVKSAGDVGGIIFAFANNPLARDEDDPKKDTEGNNISDKIATYFLMGNLNGGRIELKFGGFWGNYGYEDSKNVRETLMNPKVSEDGYTKYRIVYDGLTVKFYYLNQSNQYSQLYSRRNITLVEGAKLAFGSYTQNVHFGDLRNCVVYGMNEAACEIMGVGRTYLENLVDEANTLNENIYTSETWIPFDAALQQAEAVLADDTMTHEYINMAISDLEAAMENLVIIPGMEPLDTSELEALIAEARALNEDEYMRIGYLLLMNSVEDGEALIQAIEEGETVSQDEINAAIDDINAKMDALIPSGVIATETETESEAETEIESESQAETETDTETWFEVETETETSSTKPTIDKSALEIAINDAKALKKGDYQSNEIVWRMFQNSISAAEKVLNDKYATAKEVEDAIKNIEKRKEALIPVESVTETEAPETEAPKTEAPKTEAPETMFPETWEPGTETPETMLPETWEPGTEATETMFPEIWETDIDLPETIFPGIFETIFTETEIASTEVTDTDVSDTEEIVTEITQTDLTETEAPMTEVTETETFETDIIDTEITETETFVPDATETGMLETESSLTNEVETGTLSTDTLAPESENVQSTETGMISTETSNGKNEEGLFEGDNPFEQVSSFLGCNSTLSISALLVVGVIGTAIFVKRKED